MVNRVDEVRFILGVNLFKFSMQRRLVAGLPVINPSVYYFKTLLRHGVLLQRSFIKAHSVRLVLVSTFCRSQVEG